MGRTLGGTRATLNVVDGARGTSVPAGDSDVDDNVLGSTSCPIGPRTVAGLNVALDAARDALPSSIAFCSIDFV